MSYSLALQQANKLSNSLQDYHKLSNILCDFSSNYQIFLVKYCQNFYEQPQSYFVVIDGKSDSNLINKSLRIRRVFPFDSENIEGSDEKEKTQRQNQQSRKSAQIECTLSGDKSFDFGRILTGNFIHQNVILVLADPFELYFISPKSKSPIKLILEQQYNLSSIVASFSFESNDEQKKKQPYFLTIYGLENSTQSNKMYTVNLMTFDVRQITQSKDYAPIARKNHFRMFHDDRLYVFGGQILSKKQEEELLWSFDIQKGYWFALEMKYEAQAQIFQQFSSTVYDSGKIIILRNGFFYLLEIYQCKIWKLQLNLDEQNQLKAQISNSKIKGLLTFQKRVYFYTKNQVLALSVALQKSSKPSQKIQTNNQLSK